MEREYYFNDAIGSYREGAEIESCLTGYKYKFDFEVDKHMRKRDFDNDFKANGTIGINEINNTWIIRE